MTQATRNAIELGGGLRRWAFFFIAIAASLVGTFFLVTYFFEGATYRDSLEEAYSFIWENTTREQFTFIMRRKPWLYILPAVTIIFATGWLLPRTFWARSLFTYLVFGIGFVGGHVLWGSNELIASP